MALRPFSWLARVVRAAWAFVDSARRFTINLIFLVIAILVLVGIAGGGRARLADNTALVVDLRGDIVEQYTGGAREHEVSEALGGESRETQLRDVVAVLDGAAHDPHVARVLLRLDDMGHAGLAKLHEISAAIARVRAAGKKVTAWSSAYDQRRYFLAVQCDEVFLDPLGEVGLTGFGGYNGYYHDLLERVGVTINVFRAGKFKSFVEPFVANAPSPESQEADRFLLDDAWNGYTADVEKARGLPEGAISQWIQQRPVHIALAGGDLAQAALQSRLVDALKTREELRALFIERGAPDNAHHTFRQVSMDDYRALVPDPAPGHEQVGIIVAEGSISDGEEPQGSIGGRSTAELVRHAREDDSIRAIVLRVDSPGGSVYGSELIRRELDLARKAGKPVVVSMGDVAASGGYWISTASDRILADPGTITGSIGVFSLLPTIDRTLDKLGVHTAGVGTTWAAGAGDPRRPLDPRIAAENQAQVLNIYQQFLARVADSRHLQTAVVHESAQGRVWTGRQARERHLVDDLGGLQAAVSQAAALAKLGPDAAPTYVEAEPHGWGRILSSLPAGWMRDSLRSVAGASVAGASVDSPAGASALLLDGAAAAPGSSTLQSVVAPLAWLASGTGGGRVYAHCLCRAP